MLSAFLLKIIKYNIILIELKNFNYFNILSHENYKLIITNLMHAGIINIVEIIWYCRNQVSFHNKIVNFHTR
jgi:hypothetical protein